MKIFFGYSTLLFVLFLVHADGKLVDFDENEDEDNREPNDNDSYDSDNEDGTYDEDDDSDSPDENDSDGQSDENDEDDPDDLIFEDSGNQPYHDFNPTDDDMEDNEDDNGDDMESENKDWGSYNNVDGFISEFGAGEGQKVCNSRKCVIAAAEVLRSMNMSADPCKNFYEYACGRFGEDHQIRGFQGRLHSFALLRQRLAYDLHNIISKLKNKQALKVERQLKMFYYQCLNTKQLNKNGDIKQIKLLQKFIPWPIEGDDWPGESWNMATTLKKLILKLGVNPLFSVGIGLDDKRASVFVFKFMEVAVNLPKSYYFTQSGQKLKTIKAYLTLIRKLFQKFGLKENLSETANEVLEFERKLAKITLSPVQRRDLISLYTKKTLKAFDKMIPEIGVLDMLNEFLKNRYRKTVLTGSDKVVVLGTEYFIQLSALLKNTPPSTIAKYFVWRVIFFLGHFGPVSTQRLYHDFEAVYLGTNAAAPRWKVCLGVISSSVLDMVMGRVYVKNKFNMKNKAIVSRLVSLIRKQLIRNLKSLKWMDNKTKAAAVDKAKHIIQQVGYPKWILNDKLVTKQYKTLRLKKGSYLENFLRLQDFARKIQALIYIMKKRFRNRWTTSPAIVNAFYSESYNRIVFPAGILQLPFVDSALPTALNFGGIGTVIGHELTHGFDDNGRKYDKFGNYRSWWTPKSAKAFKNKANCIRKQYSQYSFYNKHINGALTAGENIADNGGVKMAYYAMKREINKAGYSGFKLPGLEKFTDEQLFFLGFSRLWCSISRKAFTMQRISIDHHTLPKFRVIGVLSNMKEFARAFKCPAGSPMNPKKKCVVW